MRCFFAVPLPVVLVEQIAETSLGVISVLDEDNIMARPVSKMNLHITLRFLGDVPSNRIEPLCDSVEDSIKTIGPDMISISGIKCFPNQRAPRVITLGVPSNKILFELHNTIENKLADFGIEPDEKGYTPHITLVRIKDPKAAVSFNHWSDSVEPIDFGETAVDCFHLYESILKPSGPIYSVVREFKLGR